jgi:hypothetical protein
MFPLRYRVTYAKPLSSTLDVTAPQLRSEFGWQSKQGSRDNASAVSRPIISSFSFDVVFPISIGMGCGCSCFDAGHYLDLL